MINNKILLTVIVTVYNMDFYVGRCIESIINQTYKNIELILVDDGSTDTSCTICDEYAKKDRRIIVFHKMNEGVVSARRFGVENARGDLIAFVDGDDWVDSNMYENMITEYMKAKSDLVTSGLIWEWEDRKGLLFDSIEEGVYEKNLIKNSLFPRIIYDSETKQQGITASVCNKLFNSTILKNIIKKIDPQLTLGEDGAIAYSFVGQVNRITIIHKAWYHYEQHEKSANRTFGLGAFEKIYRLKSCLLHNVDVERSDIKIESQINNYIKSFLFEAIRDVYEIDLDTITYIFPYEKIEKGSKIILYGAGKVGQSYWNCIRYGEYVELVSWVDRNYLELQSKGIPVEKIDNVMYKNFDYIIIAVEDRENATVIKRKLLNYNIPKQKLVWKRPKRIL